MKYRTSPVKIFLLSLLRRSKEFIQRMINAVSKCELLFKKAMEIIKKNSKRCAVPENIFTPRREGFEFPGGGGGSVRPRH